MREQPRTVDTPGIHNEEAVVALVSSDDDNDANDQPQPPLVGDIVSDHDSEMIPTSPLPSPADEQQEPHMPAGMLLSDMILRRSGSLCVHVYLLIAIAITNYFCGGSKSIFP